jgi:hypothetical protein
MSVLLAKGENSNSQKDLHNRSPSARLKSSNHSREKSNLRARDALRLVNEKHPVLLYEVNTVKSFIMNIYFEIENNWLKII